jgi:hypothetical protein
MAFHATRTENQLKKTMKINYLPAPACAELLSLAGFATSPVDKLAKRLTPRQIEIINTAFRSIEPRTRTVLDLLLADETMRTIGMRIGREDGQAGAVSADRARQIAAKGIRMLRHPTRLGKYWQIKSAN